jgi:immunoglobulin-binding protein 1
MSYISSLLSLKILDRSTSVPYQSMLANQSKVAVDKRTSAFPTDATNRRAIKIAALKLERSLKNALNEYREAARAKAGNQNSIRSTGLGWSNEVGDDASTSTLPVVGSVDQVLEIEYDTLALPKRQSGKDDEDEEEDEDEEATFVGGGQTNDMEVQPPSSLRSYLLMLCHLHSLLALNALDSIVTERTLLDSMPSNAQSLSQERAGRETYEAEKRQNQGLDEWRLDQRWGTSNSAPLLDAKGKPNRPFTILPSGSSASNGQASMGASATQNSMDARQRLREQVFQTSHRLPTMSIDEYLEEENRRGNIISGGGQASADAPTSSELLALRSQGQGVGTREAEEADDEQRRKADEWDEFAENNPKGMGNTMNRG